MAARWVCSPYTVLLATGYAADVVELDRGHGGWGPGGARGVRRARAGRGGPGRARAPVHPRRHPADAGLIAEVGETGAPHHGRGPWVPLPPSRVAAGLVAWAEPPATSDWGLLPLHVVADAVRLAARL